MNSYKLLLPVLAGIALSSCVASKKFKASEAARLDCETKNKALTDKVAGLENDTTQNGIRYRSLEAAKNYLEETLSSEKQQLSSELSETGKKLTSKEQLLQEREKKLQELQELLARQEKIVNDLRTKVSNALVGFKGDELSVNIKNGKVYVSLQEKLLFKSGSATVDPKGKEALGKLASVLIKNPDIDVMIEGHTDNVPLIPGKFDDNWDLSVSRATSIVRILTSDNGLDPKRVIAAGRSEYVPVAANDSPEGKSKNRRTEIILSPKLDELFQILDAKK